ncbi:hypothetical protein BDA96_01G144600 [Sorghum bicolor]|uniref:Uncharacterized protein n=2 Tax=Sorghum bicolor TaxID=4558 RepID=A0A921S0F9_SORBI|nr:hypothetical protein SORBI_3001G138500 [Sorghum bicolor]KAG0548182.1 hypothetical protein BDA96_01G144600 [Sorghum bicolor]
MGEHRGRKPSAAMRALRGARDLYVRGLRGLDRLLAAASPRRAGVGRPTSSRVFGVGGSRHSEEDLRDLVRAMQPRRAAAASVGSGGNKEDAATASGAPPVKRRGATPLQRISEDAAVVHPTS